MGGTTSTPRPTRAEPPGPLPGHSDRPRGGPPEDPEEGHPGHHEPQHRQPPQQAGERLGPHRRQHLGAHQRPADGGGLGDPYVVAGPEGDVAGDPGGVAQGHVVDAGHHVAPHQAVHGEPPGLGPHVPPHAGGHLGRAADQQHVAPHFAAHPGLAHEAAHVAPDPAGRFQAHRGDQHRLPHLAGDAHRPPDQADDVPLHRPGDGHLAGEHDEVALHHPFDDGAPAHGVEVLRHRVVGGDDHLVGGAKAPQQGDRRQGEAPGEQGDREGFPKEEGHRAAL